MADKFFDQPQKQKPKGGPEAALGEGIPMWGDFIASTDKEPEAKETEAFDEDQEPQFFRGLEETAEQLDDEGEESEASAEEAEEEVEASSEEEGDGPSRQELLDRLEQLEQRRKDTQSWGNTQNMQRLIQEQINQTLYQLQQGQQSQQQWQEQNKPPSIDEIVGDAERLLTDPDALKSTLGKALQKYAEWGRNQTLSQVAPHIAQAQNVAKFLNDIYPLQHETAKDRAIAKVKSQGMVETDAQANEVLEKAYQLIDQQAGGEAFRLRLNPEIVVAAARTVIDRDGAPVKKRAKKPPSAGKSPSGGGKSSGGKAQKTRSQRAVEKILGTKISPDKIQQVNQRRKRSVA